MTAIAGVNGEPVEGEARVVGDSEARGGQVKQMSHIQPARSTITSSELRLTQPCPLRLSEFTLFLTIYSSSPPSAKSGVVLAVPTLPDSSSQVTISSNEGAFISRTSSSSSILVSSLTFSSTI